MNRRVMWLPAVAAAAVLPGAAGAFGSDATGMPVSVKPPIGTPHSRFVISFRAPQGTGRFGPPGRHYVLAARTPHGSPGCVSQVSVSLAGTRAHAPARVNLLPGEFGRRWCAGKFAGRIDELQAPVCLHAQVCPQYVALLGTVGRFSFRVSATGTDTTAPLFTGLQRAVACTPGPQRPGEKTPFTLSWRPATDNVTPSAKLVYDIYESASSGGENFANASWVTQPGATGFRTPGLPAHGTFYFVVRARDQAGNEDGNRVERRGVDPCL